jgi:hypothetical protein
MEQVLDTYEIAPSEEEPLIAMDEASKQIVGDVYTPLPMEPGRLLREDHHYVRQGTQALFMFVDPHRGWRRVSSRDTRKRVDWAEEMRHLLEVDYPHAKKIRLVCDNLNTHSIASFYERYDAETAHRLARRLEIIHTPRNGSWLNIAEIELSVLHRDCLDRRFSSIQEMIDEIAAWQTRRNQAVVKINWHFRTGDARIKLHGIYPNIVTLPF